MDWNKLQHTLFEIEPTDPREDLAKLKGDAGTAVAAETTANYLEESVSVAEGSMPVGIDSIADFATLAGIRLDERAKQKDGDYARGDRPTPKKGSGAKRSPDEGKLVGEDNAFQRGWQAGEKSPDVVRSKVSGAITGKGNGKPNAKPKAAPKAGQLPASDRTYSQFLKQHTQALKQIAADPTKKKQFDQFMSKMTEEMDEATSMRQRKLAAKIAPKPRDSHSKDLDALRKSGAGGAHINKAKRDSDPRKMKHKGKAFAQESIKEMLLRKLNEKNGKS